MHLNYHEVSKEDFAKSKIAKFMIPESELEDECFKTWLGFCSQKYKVGEGTFG